MNRRQWSSVRGLSVAPTLRARQAWVARDGAGVMGQAGMEATLP